MTYNCVTAPHIDNNTDGPCGYEKRLTHAASGPCTLHLHVSFTYASSLQLTFAPE